MEFGSPGAIDAGNADAGPREARDQDRSSYQGAALGKPAGGHGRDDQDEAQHGERVHDQPEHADRFVAEH